MIFYSWKGIFLIAFGNKFLIFFFFLIYLLHPTFDFCVLYYILTLIYVHIWYLLQIFNFGKLTFKRPTPGTFTLHAYMFTWCQRNIYIFFLDFSHAMVLFNRFNCSIIQTWETVRRIRKSLVRSSTSELS